MTLPTRFWSKVNKTETCWLWIASLDQSGYGSFNLGPGMTKLAHRIAYEGVLGPIPDGLVLDHLCRTRCCVNPEHLEPVTRAENNRRGEGGLHNKVKTHCPAGHEFTPENIVWQRQGQHRSCRECKREQGMAYYFRKTAA